MFPLASTLLHVYVMSVKEISIFPYFFNRAGLPIKMSSSNDNGYCYHLPIGILGVELPAPTPVQPVVQDLAVK